MNAVLVWIFVGSAVVGVASAAVLVATVMRNLFDRHRLA